MEAFLRLIWGSVRLAGAGLAVLLTFADLAQGNGLALAPVGLAVAAAGLAPGPVLPRTASAVAASGLATLAVVVSDAGQHSFGLAEAGGLGILLVQGTRWLPVERARWLVPLTALTVMGLTTRISGTPAGETFTVALGFCVVLAVGVGLSLRFQDEVRAREAAQLRTDDRLALARELHDTVAHAVTAMVVRAQAAQMVAPGGDGAVRSALADIDREGSRALAEMRRVVGLLRAGDAPEAPAATTMPVDRLRSLVTGFSGDRLQATVQVDASLERAELPVETGVALQRLVQEALTNVHRHAPGAHRAHVAIGRSLDRVTVTVDDDGPPVPCSSPSAGFGLLGLGERMALLGGAFDAGPGPSGGWRVTASLPLAP